MWPTQSETTIEAAAFREGIVTSSELPSDLLVCGSASGHKNHVKAGETEYWNDQQRDDHYDND